MAQIPPGVLGWGPSAEFGAEKKITLRPAKKMGCQFHEEEADSEAPKKRIYKNHACVSAEPVSAEPAREKRERREKKMLARVFKIDVTTCGHCGAKMQKVCAVTNGDSTRRYLKYLGLDADSPCRTAAKIVQPELSFDQNYQSE